MLKKVQMQTSPNSLSGFWIFFNLDLFVSDFELGISNLPFPVFFGFQYSDFGFEF
jgi:hypothetical protein